jgi:hypothetical protein
MADHEALKKLREPFQPEQIGQLPKPYRKDSPKANCNVCGGYHGLPAAHLDFVGHAVTTARLLNVDPEWTWEPMGRTTEGLPALDRSGNLWILLTIGGVTRPGVGDGSSMKECIGDAIRNAAMRFGVALDLWSKEDLHAAEVEKGTEPTPQERAFREAKVAAWRAWCDYSEGTDTAAMQAEYEQWCAQPFADAEAADFTKFSEYLRTQQAERKAQP